MSEKKKRRNDQIYREYQGLLKEKVNYWDAYVQLGQKYDLAPNTIRVIVGNKNYGTYRKKHIT